MDAIWKLNILWATYFFVKENFETNFLKNENEFFYSFIPLEKIILFDFL